MEQRGTVVLRPPVEMLRPRAAGVLPEGEKCAGPFGAGTETISTPVA